jgi:putative transposase
VHGGGLAAGIHEARYCPDLVRLLAVPAGQGPPDAPGYVVLENHIHFIASADDLANEVGDFKSYTARRIVDFLRERQVHTLLEGLEYHKARHKTDRTFQVWQEGSHPEVIENEEMLRQKIEYIHQNPVKRGYVCDPTHWRYSSARNYAKIEELVSVSTDW